MATVNVEFSKDWTKIVNTGSDFLLTIADTFNNGVEVAVSPASAAVSGHVINGERGESINRALIGPGDVYARKTTDESVFGALTVWVP